MPDDQSYRWMRNVLDHKRLVGVYLQRVVSALFERATVHDFSKFDAEEFGPYAAALPRYEKAIYGTEEYNAVSAAIWPAIDRHVHGNRHHPEYFPNGINDMNLLDVVEMVCDWIAASQRTPGSTLRLDLQRERFGINDQLYGIICRTVEALAPEVPSEQ